MIHYHGSPITPMTAAIPAITAGHAFVSFAHPEQLGLAVEVCQSFAIDNGAFSAWKSGNPVTDWRPFYAWAEEARRIPSCDFAVIPDVIDGTEEDNDRLIAECPLPSHFAAPVWHLHESLERLQRLAEAFPRVCFGSSGAYSSPNAPAWWRRIHEAMAVVCDDRGRPLCRIHGLRMLNMEVFSRIPFASADSTAIARGIGVDVKWKGTYQPPTKEARAMLMRQRIEVVNAPAVWVPEKIQQQDLFN